MAATETAFRPHVDQENAQALNIKGGTFSGKLVKRDQIAEAWDTNKQMFRA